MAKKKFTRRNTTKYSRLGKKRKKLQKWRRPKGRHNKMRDYRKSYPSRVQEGYKNKSDERNSIEGKKIVIVSNIKQLENIKKNEIVLLGRLGKKKKAEIAKIIKEKNISVINLNVDKLIKSLEKIEKDKGAKK
ncbi:MAG: eL32 family ribosomal protein [Candidatus Pacearchaeota archaeon]